MVNQKNYYEMAYRLYNAMCELVNTDKQDFTELYEKSRAIIYEYDFLKEKYTENVILISESIKNEKFISLYENNYNLIQETLKKRLNDKEVALIYHKNTLSDGRLDYEVNAQFKSSIEEQFKNLDEELDWNWDNWDELLGFEENAVFYTFTEHPEYFYYPSCMALLFKDFTQYDEECNELDKDINLEICLSLKQFYTYNFHCSVDIPENFEYYISATNFSITDDLNIFDKGFYITALYHVMADLYKIAQDSINNELYNSNQQLTENINKKVIQKPKTKKAVAKKREKFSPQQQKIFNALRKYVLLNNTLLIDKTSLYELMHDLNIDEKNIDSALSRLRQQYQEVNNTNAVLINHIDDKDDIDSNYWAIYNAWNVPNI